MTSDATDRPSEVRSGEELDTEALRGFLRREMSEVFAGRGPETPIPEAPIQVRQFRSGYSNLTYLVRVGDRELILRRPPFGSQVATAHDMEREYRVLSRLQPLWDKAPPPLVLCQDPAVLGAPFYLMERVRGMILRRDPPPGIELDPDTARGLSKTLVDTLVELHGLDLEATGLGELGKPEGYVERQVRGWTERYQGSKTDDIPQIEQVAERLAARLPEVAGQGDAAFVHNDFKYDNLVLDPAEPTRVLAVLDWEMATVGDPLLDLGTSLGYWVEADDPEPLQRFRFGPTHLPGSLTRREIAERYAEGSGRDLSHLDFHYAFGLFKIAVIAQQIYYRYVQGQTRDERFAPLIHAIRALGGMAFRVTETGEV